jgi:prepilin-type N-terminal cleavage/methylation domain-containing protein
MKNFKINKYNGKWKIKKWKFRSGFTLIELMVSIGILLVLFALTTINLSNLPSNTAQTSDNDRLITDFRSQQTKAMSDASPYGIYFDQSSVPNSYILFKGNSFTEGTDKFTIDLEPTVSFSAVPSGSELVFTSGSGDTTPAIISLKNNQTNKTTDIKINRYGATTN